MSAVENIEQGLVAAVGRRVGAVAPVLGSVSTLDAQIERLAAPRRENAGMGEVNAFMWGAHPIASSKRAALVRLRLDAEHAAWRARQSGGPEQG